MITNWAGNVRFQPKRQHRPLSLEEMQRALAGAERVRAVGSAHSFNRVADTDGVLIDLSGMPRHVELDSERRLARVSGGWTYGDLCPELHAAGWALGNLASLPHIIVAGACATATHGSGRRNACLANEIEEVELIGGGRVPWCTEPRCLNALQEHGHGARTGGVSRTAPGGRAGVVGDRVGAAGGRRWRRERLGRGRLRPGAGSGARGALLPGVARTLLGGLTRTFPERDDVVWHGSEWDGLTHFYTHLYAAS